MASSQDPQRPTGAPASYVPLHGDADRWPRRIGCCDTCSSGAYWGATNRPTTTHMGAD